MFHFSLHTVWLSGVLVLTAAIILSLAGAALLLYTARMNRDAIGRRISLLSGNVLPAKSRAPVAPALIRSQGQGLKEREQREVAQAMDRFGVPPQWALTALLTVRLVAMAVLAGAGFTLMRRWMGAGGPAMLPILVATALAICGWFIPGMAIGKMVKSRLKAVVVGLPDALELLVICVEAGLSFEDGLDRIAGVLQVSQPALAEELALTAADLKILPSREQALANLAARVNAPSIRSVVTTLSQTLRYGTPLAQALRVISAELRNESLMKLEERANQLPTLMTIPMMLFIMPTIFMVVAGPAILRVLDAFKH